MPRKKIESAAELAVCRRLEEARELLRVPQTTAARILGITRNKLTNYESGTVAIPLMVGVTFCETFGFSQLWLATGELPQRLVVPVKPGFLYTPEVSFLENLLPNADYFRVYFRTLASQLGTEVELLDAVDVAFTVPLPLPFGHWRAVANSAAQLTSRFAERLPPELHAELLSGLVSYMRSFEKQHVHDVIRWLDELRHWDRTGMVPKITANLPPDLSVKVEKASRRGE